MTSEKVVSKLVKKLTVDSVCNKIRQMKRTVVKGKVVPVLN
jgi:hypothetical protein